MNYKKIGGDIKLARIILLPENNPTNDESMVDLASFHAQQAIEKILKYYLNNNYGIDETSKEFKIHDIEKLLLKIDEFDKNFKESNVDLHEISVELTSWSVVSRYGKSYISNIKTIKSALDIADRLYDDILTNLYDYKKRYEIGCNGYAHVKETQAERILDKLLKQKNNLENNNSQLKINKINKRISKIEIIKNNKNILKKFGENKLRSKNQKLTKKYDRLIEEEKEDYLGYTRLTCMIFGNKSNINVFDEWVSTCINIYKKDIGVLNYALVIDIDDFRLSKECSINYDFNLSKSQIIVSTLEDAKYYNKNIDIENTKLFRNMLKKIKNAKKEGNDVIKTMEKAKRYKH